MLLLEKKKITRVRLGCHRCKKFKVKCPEQKPACATCIKAGAQCDYSLKLTWGGRPFKNKQRPKSGLISGTAPGFQALPMARHSLSMTSSIASTIEFVPSVFSPKDIAASPMAPASSTDSLIDFPTPRSRKNSRLLELELIQVKCETSSMPIAREGNTLPYSGWEQVVTEELLLTGWSSENAIAVHVKSGYQPPLNAVSDSSPMLLSMILPKTTFERKEECIRTVSDYVSFASKEPLIGSPQKTSPFTNCGMDRSDSFSTDIARIEHTFPTEQRLPFFENTYFYSPSRKSSPSPEELETRLVNALEHTPKAILPTACLEKKPEDDAAMNLIPPLLLPLPEILLKVPYYRQLLHFWVDVAAENLVPAPYLYKENPFKKILPQMAMYYPGLLTTILAFAARARDDMEGSHGTHQRIIDQLLGRSCDELVKQLRDRGQATSDGTFATSLLLSSFEVVHSNDFSKHRAHTTGASQIMVARSRKSLQHGDAQVSVNDSPDSPPSESSVTRRNESDIAYFLLRWFMYVDVMGALSSTRERLKYLRAYRRHEKYTPIESIPHLNTKDWGRDIDYLLGFDPTLLPHFVNISLLIDEVENYMASPVRDVECLPIFITSAALELKEKFRISYEAGEANRLVILDEIIEKNGKFAASKSRELMTKDNILRSTNRLYYDAGLLNLYRRILLLPRLSPLVQDLIDEMTEIFEFYIESCSPAELCTIFCLFSAGCDALNEDKRAFYKSRFQALEQQENRNATKCLVIMNRCWDTGEDLYTAANALDIDLVLL